jgi:hypothetical protein
MKKLILLILTTLSVAIFAQTSVSEVVEVLGATSSTLNSRLTSFLKARKVESKTLGIATTGTGTFMVNYPSVKKGMNEVGLVRYQISVSVKDGKYKLVVNNLQHEGIKGQSAGGSIDLEKPTCGETQITSAAWAKIKEQAKTMLEAFVKDLKSNLDGPAKVAPASSDF